MAKERLYIIYALVDPRDESMRYIGITDNMPMRFKQHLREAGSITAKGMWLAELQRYGLRPAVRILEEIQIEKTQRYLVEERERYWIQALEQSGVSLTNIQDTLLDTRKPFKRERMDSYGFPPIQSGSPPPIQSGRRSGVKAVYTLDELRERAGLRINELADLAGISVTTLRRMIQGKAVSYALISRVLRVLSQRLGYDIIPNKVPGLKGF
jgi:predicted GIY-YIG superfamily endonuclease